MRLRCALAQREFLVSSCETLKKMRAVALYHNVKWSSPALAILKPGTDTFHFTVYLRKVNGTTIPVVSPMPDLEEMCWSVGEIKAFKNMDMCPAYWQKLRTADFHMLVTTIRL